MLRALRILTVVLLAGAIGLTIAKVRSYRNDATPLDDLGSLGEFSFTSSTGGTISDRDLNGKVCVFACFFTCCTESCPQISGSMARLQSELSDVADLRLVSLTVDPETDTPEKLAAYGKTFGAEPNRWLFLTGPREQVESFVIGRLRQAVEENKDADRTPGNKMLHSSRLTLVDTKGTIRGLFDGTSADEVDKLKLAVRRLARER